MLGNLIGGFIVILVGTSLAPTVAQQVGTAQADGNVTGASDTLLGLTTLFYSLAIATSAIGIAALGLTVKSQPTQEVIFELIPEYRLISLRGQDRSVTSQYARTTDKGFQSYGIIYSLNSENKMKSEINNYVRNSGLM